MRPIKQVQNGAKCVLGLLIVAASGCGNSPDETPSQPTTPTPSVMMSKTQGVARGPSTDAFGVPSGFRPSYALKEDENISLSKQDTRRKVRIVVPAGLPDTEVENNMRAAAEKAYRKDFQPHAIIVFAYKPGTDIHNQYTAGRLQWAPGGDWTRADEDVPVGAHKAAVDIYENYRPKPKAKHTASQSGFDALVANVDTWERKREAKLNKHISESRRRRIYFAVMQAMNSASDSPPPGGDIKAVIDANVAAVCSKYHITTDNADIIRTEGDAQGWPQPQ